MGLELVEFSLSNSTLSSLRKGITISIAMTGYVGRGSGIVGRVFACIDSFVSFSHQGENESLAGEANDLIEIQLSNINYQNAT